MAPKRAMPPVWTLAGVSMMQQPKFLRAACKLNVKALAVSERPRCPQRATRQQVATKPSPNDRPKARSSQSQPRSLRTHGRPGIPAAHIHALHEHASCTTAWKTALVKGRVAVLETPKRHDVLRDTLGSSWNRLDVGL